MLEFRYYFVFRMSGSNQKYNVNIWPVIVVMLRSFKVRVKAVATYWALARPKPDSSPIRPFEQRPPTEFSKIQKKSVKWPRHCERQMKDFYVSQSCCYIQKTWPRLQITSLTILKVGDLTWAIIIKAVYTHAVSVFITNLQCK